MGSSGINNQSTHQSTNQRPNIQSTNQDTNQTDRCTNQSTNQSTNAVRLLQLMHALPLAALALAAVLELLHGRDKGWCKAELCRGEIALRCDKGWSLRRIVQRRNRSVADRELLPAVMRRRGLQLCRPSLLSLAALAALAAPICTTICTAITRAICRTIFLTERITNRRTDNRRTNNRIPNNQRTNPRI